MPRVYTGSEFSDGERNDISGYRNVTLKCIHANVVNSYMYDTYNEPCFAVKADRCDVSSYGN